MANDRKDGSANRAHPRPYHSRVEFRGSPDGAAPGFASGHDFPPDFPEDGISRRRFLNLLSASAALALGTSCSRIDRGRIVPYTRRPQEIIPGVATYYASTFQEGFISHGVLVKTREGRPLHIEGNPEDPISRGKTNLRAIADLLGLYDPDRLAAPAGEGKPVSWQAAEMALAQALQDARRAGRPVLLLTDAITSPSRRMLIEDLKRALPTLRHAVWEPAASQSEFLASQALYGEWVQPRIRLDRAEVVLSLQADFLGSDGNAPFLARDFAARRRVSHPTDPMNRLWVMEGCMTLTGANADHRVRIRPTHLAALGFALARSLHETHGVPLPPGLGVDELKPFSLVALAREEKIEPALLQALTADLYRSGKSSLVLAGGALPPAAHMACQLINVMLGAEGYTVDATLAPAVSEFTTLAGLHDILSDAARGEFSAAIFWRTNPAFSFPGGSLWKEAAAGIPLKFRIGLYEDETARACGWRLPEHHWLESWGDFEPAADLLSLRQPVMGAIHDSRQGEDILLGCLPGLGVNVPSPYVEYLKARWQREVYPSGSPASFDAYWNASLHDGVVRRAAVARPPRALRVDAVREGVRSAATARASNSAGEFELVLTPDAAVYDGRYANNGWLNEFPDPVTKATWGNPLLISIADATRLGIMDEDEVRVTVGDVSVEVPALLQPGQAPGTVSLACGHGRSTGNVGGEVGVNAYPLMDAASATPQLRVGAAITRTGRRRTVPRTQDHDRMEGRDPARSMTLEEYSGQNPERREAHGAAETASLIPGLKFAERKWGMVIDLSACVGCGACVVACQSENNIPVVGPDQVHAGRVMHWIRIDRYYEGNPEAPSVRHQPIPCQHCDNAPCEIVCPVNATTHSPDGVNQMAYNRCVGTRYCSNNCPFKVRRFNFFDYTSMKKAPENLVFNPEVTVRPRGVMEKCSFCYQRIENVKLQAQAESRPIRDGEINPACAVACPAEAIVFGDLNDSGSAVSGLARVDRGYRMLDELGIKAAVTYLTDISNPVRGKGRA